MNTATLDPSKPKLDPADLSLIDIGKGSHDDRAKGCCAVELVAWLAGLPHSDAPPCVSIFIRRFVIDLNDRSPDEPRQRLKEVLPLMLDTAADQTVERQRAFAVADWAVRTVLPMALDTAKLPERAAKIRALQPLIDRASAEEAAKACREARAAYAASAASAASAAAYAAYASAAYAYASAAYAYASAYAYAASAADAAYASAAYASAASAYAYAYARLSARVKAWHAIMDSAIPLIRRLCAMGKAA